MRVPSTGELWTAAGAAARRFPETLALALSACALAIGMSFTEFASLHRLLGTCLVGIPLSFAVAAAWGSSPRRAVASTAVALLLALHYGLTLHEPLARYWTRLLQVLVAAHLLVAFLPYVGRGPAGCWEWNARLFARFALAAFFSAVAYVGLVLSLATADSLLDVSVSGRFYWRLFLVVVFGVNTWVFLAGVPDPLPRKDVDAAYPRQLRVFVQYVLVPLVTLYLLILYLYAARIVATGEWPRGTIGFIVSAFSLIALLMLLLGDPLRRGASSWFDRYARGLCALLVPLVVLLALGTWRRVAEYGLTERRYLLFALGGWIGAAGMVLARTRRDDIRLVPASLFLVTVLTAAGPWGAYAISWRSQLARLERTLHAHGLDPEMRLRGETPPGIPLAARREISALLDYVNDVHGGRGLERWFPAAQVAAIAAQSVSAVPSHDRDNPSIAFMHTIGLEYARASQQTDETPFSYGSGMEGNAPLDLSGFDGLVTVRLFGDGRHSIAWKGRTLEVFLGPGSDQLSVTDGRSPATFALSEPVESARRTAASPHAWGPVVLTVASETLRVRLRLRQVSGARLATPLGAVRLTSVVADVLFRVAD
jgi:hypothetical protein